MGQNGETEEPGCDDENLNCEAKSSVRRRQPSQKSSKTENEKVYDNDHLIMICIEALASSLTYVHIVTNPWHMRVYSETAHSHSFG